jgi:hypothetical protein
MAESQKGKSLQSLGNGVYRVNNVGRSAVSGRYVSSESAARHPRTSTSHVSTGRESGKPIAPKA